MICVSGSLKEGAPRTGSSKEDTYTRVRRGRAAAIHAHSTLKHVCTVLMAVDEMATRARFDLVYRSSATT